MYRKLLVVGSYCLMTLFLMPHLADAQTSIITGPWLWMIAPNGTGQGGAASTDVDSLAVASDGAVTETDIATNGAQEGDFIGNYRWTPGELRTTGIENTLDFTGEIDNVTDLLKRLGWANGEVLNHSSYALIILESAIARNAVTMRVGSDDAIKVWLNGAVVHRNPVDRGSGGFQDEFQVNLKQGDNLVLVKVSQGWGNWSMFVGVDANVTPKLPVSDDLFQLGAATKIYWTEGWGERPGTAKIRRANPDGSNVEDLFTNQMAVTRLSVDTVGGKLYWMDGHGDGTSVFIRRSNFDGSNLETVVESTFSNILVSGSLTLDVANGRMYWRSWLGLNGARSQFANSANLDGSGKRDVEEIPAELGDNFVNGKIYWHDRDQDVIRRSNLDGSSVENIVREQFVAELTVDGISGKIYWYDYDRLRRANLDGSNVENLLNEGEVSELTIDGVGGKMYWRNYDLAALRRANLDGSNAEIIVRDVEFTPSIVILPSTPTSTPSDPTDLTVSLSPASVASPSVGQQLTLNLNIENGVNITTFEATLTFDASALQYVSSEIGDYLPGNPTLIGRPTSQNQLKLIGTSIGGAVGNGDGTLATVTFEVLAAKASTVRLSDVSLVDSSIERLRPRVVGAEITELRRLPQDVNGDDVVDILDLALVAGAFGQTGDNIPADVNGDNVVDILDLALVAGAFGQTTDGAAASPAFTHRDIDTLLSRAEVETWLRQAQEANISTPEHQRGIAVLQALLTALTPKETALLANYPNPFNPETWIPYQLAEDSDVSIAIYAADGQLVRTLDLGHQPTGLYQTRSRAAYWNGRNAIGEPVASGIYFYTLNAGEFNATRKMLIRK